MRVVLFYFLTLLATFNVADASVTLVPLSSNDKTIHDFPFVGKVMNINTHSAGSGTVIGDGLFVLTAKHVVTDDRKSTGLLLEGSNFIFEIDDKNYDIERVYGAPNSDIAILKLVEPCPYYIDKLYDGMYIDTEFYGVGYGSGCIEACSHLLTWDMIYGIKRIYKNKFVFASSVEIIIRNETIIEQYLHFILHDPETLGQPFGAIEGEGLHGPGDSGGGIFVVKNGEIYLAGVICAISQGVLPYRGIVAGIHENRNWIEAVTGVDFFSGGDCPSILLMNLQDPNTPETILMNPNIWAIRTKNRKMFPFR